MLIIFYSYATILGSSPADTISLHPSVPCLPDLSSHENSSVTGSLQLGKYTEWFNDVFSPDISNKCEDALTAILKLTFSFSSFHSKVGIRLVSRTALRLIVICS